MTKEKIIKISAPVKKLTKMCSQKKYTGKILVPRNLKFLGVFILPGFFTEGFIKKLFAQYKSDKSKYSVPFHPTRVEFKNDNLLDFVLNNKKLRNLISSGAFYAGNVAVSRPFVFRKDKDNKEKVILHNDIDYMMGAHERYSFFIPLTRCTPQNGSIIVYPGTHHFGSLGDAGEINSSILPEEYPCLQTDLKPGDLLIMNSALWHMSNSSIDKSKRIYFEIKLTDANCPTAYRIVSGRRTSEFTNNLSPDEIFTSSRVQKLRKFYKSNN